MGISSYYFVLWFINLKLFPVKEKKDSQMYYTKRNKELQKISYQKLHKPKDNEIMVLWCWKKKTINLESYNQHKLSSIKEDKLKIFFRQIKSERKCFQQTLTIRNLIGRCLRTEAKLMSIRQRTGGKR